MKSLRWYKSIRFRIPAVTALIILLPMLAFWYYYNNSTMQNMIEATTSSMYTNIYGASLRMEDLLDEATQFSKTLCNDKTFKALIERYRSDAFDKTQTRSGLTLALSQHVGELRSLDSLFLVFSDMDTILTSIPDMKAIDIKSAVGKRIYTLYDDYFKNNIGWYSLPSHSDKGQPMLSYVRPIEINGEMDKCVLICNVKSSSWENIVNISGLEHGTFDIADYDGRVLLSNRQDWQFDKNIKGLPEFEQAFASQEDYVIYQVKTNSGVQLVMYYNSVEAGWKYLATLPLSYLLLNMEGQVAFMIVISILALFSAALGAVLLFFSLVKPLNLLMRKMKGMENGDLEPVEQIRQQDEIGVLLQSYNHMIGELKKLIDEVYVQQLLTKQAQLKTLQSQMDEHFLYNTLNTIYCEACHENAVNSAEMLIVLSKYFRLSLSKGKDKVKLSEVVELIKYYLLIQKMRFSDRLSVTLDAFPEADQYVALKYLFQPIVENAIIHGFENKGTHCNVDIILRKEADILYFEVRDNGAGMDRDLLTQIKGQINSVSKVEGEGYALKNVQEQINITYGREYKIQIESEKGKGTKVSFRIPLERCSENE